MIGSEFIITRFWNRILKKKLKIKKIEDNVLTQKNEIGKTINNIIHDIGDFTDTSDQTKFNENNQVKNKDNLLLDISS